MATWTKAKMTEFEAPLSDKEELEMRIYSFAIYNEDREAFCLFMQRLSSWLGIMSGTALMATIRFESALFSLIFGFGTTSLSTLNLLADFSGLAKRHASLRNKLVEIGYNLETDNDISKAKAAFNKLYADCPIIYHAAFTLAYNAMQINRGRKTILKVSRFQRRFRHFLRWETNSFSEHISIK